MIWWSVCTWCTFKTSVKCGVKTSTDISVEAMNMTSLLYLKRENIKIIAKTVTRCGVTN